MTYRERILATINHCEPDKVPVDLGFNPSSGISAAAYGKVLSQLNIDAPIRIYDVVRQLALPGEAVIDRFGIDVVDIAQFFCEDQNNWRETILHDGQKAFYPQWFRPEKQSDGSFAAFNRSTGKKIATMPESAWFFDQNYFPWEKGYPSTVEQMSQDLDEEMDHVLWSHFVHRPWDQVNNPGFWEKAREKVKEVRGKSDKAFMVVVGCNHF